MKSYEGVQLPLYRLTHQSYENCFKLLLEAVNEHLIRQNDGEISIGGTTPDGPVAFTLKCQDDKIPLELSNLLNKIKSVPSRSA